jgi:FkbM family methyltransferase
MNPITRTIHRMVIRIKMEEFFVRLRGKANFFRRFIPVSVRHKFTSFGRLIPQSSEYPKDDAYSITRDGTNFKINRSDYVQWRIFYGVRDNALQKAKTKLASDSIALDIGANFGAFSLRLATAALQHQVSNFHIHAFEPNPGVFKNFTENLRLNASISEMVVPHSTGLGSENGERSFQYPDINTGAGRVTRKDSAGQFQVKIETLDAFVSTLNPPAISFIKMIVEGFEPEVFKGGWNTIERFKPPVFFEVTPEWYAENNSSLEEIVDRLHSLGYSFSGEYYNELIPYTPAKFKSLYQFNMLAEVRS